MYHENGVILDNFLESLKNMKDHGERGLEIQKIVDEIYKKGKRIRH